MKNGRRAAGRKSDRLTVALRRLATEGLVTIGSGRVKPFAPGRLARGARLSTAVLEDRG